MTGRTLDAVVAAIDSLIAGAFDSDKLPEAMEQTRSLFDGSKACISQISPSPTDCMIFATHVDEALEARCFGDLADEFALFGKRLESVPVGVVYRDYDVMGGERLRRTRVWQEWMKPQDMFGGLGTRLIEFGDSYWFFDVQRGEKQEAFGTDDIELLDRLAPVLRRVAEIRRQVQHLRFERDDARAALDRFALGVIFVDADMRIEYVNAGAEDILSSPTAPLTAVAGRLAAPSPGTQLKLKAGIDNALRSAANPFLPHSCHLILPDRGGGHRLAACIVPAASGGRDRDYDRGRAMITLRALSGQTDLGETARQLFDLTEAESRLAAALADGLSVAEAAQCHRIKISTARTHLARIFQKTGVRQQSQLVALLRNIHMPVRQRDAIGAGRERSFV